MEIEKISLVNLKRTYSPNPNNQGVIMNDQLNNILAEVLKASKDGIVNIALFAQQQAPDLAKEIITWGFWSNLSCTLLSPVGLFISYKMYQWGEKIKKEDDYSSIPILLNVVEIILIIIFVLVFCFSLEEMIKCIVAPKLYLMDYIKDLIKPSK